MNKTVESLTSTQRRMLSIEKRAVPALVKLVKDGAMPNWTATHIVSDGWPADLQNMVAEYLLKHGTEKKPVAKAKAAKQPKKPAQKAVAA